ncbi:hypothetical protein DFH07DRAFT_770470 [Mycena maculata]|uniref:Uncharacterized protein n=1 Tax=Mycena maculata TaxID=230809 RepID=A0AAD7JKU8_9AGAR|nr:hypothetical protein DFH07DRAFT_770470 [Mycena maculata]
MTEIARSDDSASRPRKSVSDTLDFCKQAEGRTKIIGEKPCLDKFGEMLPSEGRGTSRNGPDKGRRAHHMSCLWACGLVGFFGLYKLVQAPARLDQPASSALQRCLSGERSLDRVGIVLGSVQGVVSQARD